LRAASTGSLRECLFWTTDVVGPLKIDAAICAFDLGTVKRFGFLDNLHFLDSHLWICALG
jgi:hypothetical protein